MDPPAEGIELKPEKLEEEKEGGPLFHCDFCDADIVYKIGQSFLPGLASACIDNTTGGLFKTPAAVAVDIRREMVDYLIQRSENFVAESVVLDGGADVEVSVDPYDIISDFVDDFVHSKRNFFSRVSGWLLSEKREDWIDDLVQEMELNGFWLLNRRNTVAQTLLKNLDFKNIYHCDMNFKSVEDLEKHESTCSFRTVTCTNEGCDSAFSAAQMDHHDSICPFKMLQCEQHCPDIIMRREMDRHCITTCPMKFVKCPFHSVGCQSTIPQSTIEQHRSENLASHMLYVLQVLHKEAAREDLEERVKEVEQASSPGRIASARDARSLTFVIKDIEAKLGPLAKSDEQVEDSTDKKEEKMDVPSKDVRFEEPPSEKEATVGTPSKGSSDEESDHGNGELMESSTDVSAPPQTNETDSEKEVTVNSPSKGGGREESDSEKEVTVKSPSKGGGHEESPTDVSAPSQTNEKEVVASMQENLKESPSQREEGIGSPAKFDEQVGKSSREEAVDPIEEEHSTSTIEQDKLTESVAEKEEPAELTTKNEETTESPPAEESSNVTTTIENETSIKSPLGKEHLESTNTEVSNESAPGQEDKDSLKLS